MDNVQLVAQFLGYSCTYKMLLAAILNSMSSIPEWGLKIIFV